MMSFVIFLFDILLLFNLIKIMEFNKKYVLTVYYLWLYDGIHVHRYLKVFKYSYTFAHLLYITWSKLIKIE